MALKRSNAASEGSFSLIEQQDGSSSSSSMPFYEGGMQAIKVDESSSSHVPVDGKASGADDDDGGGDKAAGKGGGWFSRMRSKRQESDVDDSERGESGGERAEVQSNFQSITSRTIRDPRNIETIPDCETEYHEAIRDHGWDELDTLLKDYNYEVYRKIPPKPKKKQTKKLRVAKYLPELPKFSKEKIVSVSPLLGLDALGRTPLHLCCVEPVPTKLLLRVLNSARDAAAVKDSTESLPIHLAVQNGRSVDVLEKLVRGYFQGSWTPDGKGRTPLIWAVEVARKKQQEEAIKPTSTFWGFPSSPDDVAWQDRQTKLWEVVLFFVKNRESRKKKLLSTEHGQIVVALGQSAPPELISLMISAGKIAFKKEAIAGRALSLMISRQYPIGLLEKLLAELPQGFAKLHKDETGRGVVAAHYRVGCVSHQADPTHKRDSFRVTMQHLAHAQNDLHEEVVPSAQYMEWWEKLKLLINLWGTHSMDEDEPGYFHEDELLLHNVLSNSDSPPSLIQLLAALYPDSPELEHPKSKSLPLHLACRVWRFRSFPPRRGEKEIKLDRVAKQLIESDPSRTRKRYRDRLPLHHAIVSGKEWDFVKPLIIQDRKSLQVRDPITKLYPFEMAAMKIDTNFDIEVLTQQAFAPAVWRKMRDYEQDHEMRKVQHHYNLQQLSLVYELLRHSPDAISHEKLLHEIAAKRAQGIQRRNVSEMFVEASDDVVNTTQVKLVRAMFGLQNVSGHFIGWCYENTPRGWKPHRRNFAVVKEAIMDGFIPIQMDKWWKKLKVWLWQDCPWENIPRRDDYLLHCALCNPDVSPWIIELLLECFPRSATIALPGSNGCYPLHIACVTNKYAPLSFEFSNPRNVIEMVASVFHDAMLLKWNNQLPLHLGIAKLKQWDELQFMAEDEPVSLAIPDADTDFFPFQFAALHRPYTKSQRRRFESMAMTEVGKDGWRKASPAEKVAYVSKVLEKHEIESLGTIFELLRKNPMLVSVGIIDFGGGRARFKADQFSREPSQRATSSKWLNSLEANLSVASLAFLEEVYETENSSEKQLLLAVPSSNDVNREVVDRHRMNTTTRRNVHSTRAEQSATETREMVRDEERTKWSDEDYENIEHDEYEEMVESATNLDSDKAILSAEYVGLELRDVEDTEGDWNEVVPSHPLAGSFLSHPRLAQPRNKDMIVVTRSAAFVVSKTASATSEASDALSAARTSTNFWLKTLKAVGEKADAGHVHDLRRRFDQTAFSSCVIGNLTLFFDEDEDNIWLLCGMDALSFIEGYDIGIAVALEPVLSDDQTGYWLDDFHDVVADTTSAPQDDYGVLTLILDTIAAKRRERKDEKELAVSRSMFREAFGNSDLNTNLENDNEIIASGCRKLLFAVALEKLETRFHKLRRIPIRFQIAHGLRFEQNKEMFSQSQKRAKFLKSLKRKQRGAKRRRVKSPHRSSPRKSGRKAAHLEGLNQPALAKEDDDAKSLATNELFEEPLGLPPARPLLSAAIKAREQSDQNKYSTGAEHLVNASQPRATEDDNRSLDVDDLFVKKAVDPPAKPLLSAALNAREQSKQDLSRKGEHLIATNQPRILHNDDLSIDQDDLFDQPIGTIPAKPLLSAALQAREQSKQRSYTKKARHLRGMNQPKKNFRDDKSIDESDLFLEPEPHPPARPLLAAAIRARESQKQDKFCMHGDHLDGMNQPKIRDIDNHSIDADDLFDGEPQGMAPANALKTAAVKAREQSQLQRYVASAEHLKFAHQPKSSLDDDRSIGRDDLFDQTRDPLPARPLMAAAIRAREKAKEEGYSKNAEHLRHIHQPKSLYAEDKSIDEEDLFETGALEPPSQKPLLTAAYKAREEQRGRVLRSGGNGSNSGHLKFAHQPHSALEDDSVSLGLLDVFNGSGRKSHGTPPKKPLLQAAMKAKEERDAAENLRSEGKQTPRTKTKYHRTVDNHSFASVGGDSFSLTMDEVFDPPRGVPSAKPLLTAALKAKEGRTNSPAPRILARNDPPKSPVLVKKRRGAKEGNWHSAFEPEPSESEALHRPSAPGRRASATMTADLVRKNSLEIKNKSRMTSPTKSKKSKTKRKSPKATSSGSVTASVGEASDLQSPTNTAQSQSSRRNKTKTTKTSSSSTSTTTETKKGPGLFGRIGRKSS